MQLNLWSIPCSYHPTTTKLIAIDQLLCLSVKSHSGGMFLVTSLTPKGAIRPKGRAYKPEHPKYRVGG